MMSSSGSGGSLGEGEAAALIAGEDLLSRDNIPDENQKTACFSCGGNMVGLFCHSCGQKNDNYRRSIWSLFTEAFASIFSLESRIWRTWLMLLVKPGHVSREFSDGKRTNWTSPVRVYLALSIILFGYMSLTETRIFSIRTDIVAKAGFVGDIEELEDSSVRLVPDFGFFRRQAEIDRLNSGTDFNRVSRLMNGIPRQKLIFKDDLSSLGNLPSDDALKSIGYWPASSENGEDFGTDTDARSIALDAYSDDVEDVVERYNNILFSTRNPETIIDRILTAEEGDQPLDIIAEAPSSATEDLKNEFRESLKELDRALENIGLERRDLHTLPIETGTGFTFNIGAGTMNGVQFTQSEMQEVAVQLLKNPALMNEGISRYLPRIMFLMMPFAALIGLVFIRGKKTALLYDHLVHATYIHAVTFAFLLSLILISQWTPITNIIQIFFVGVAIYLPLSAKRMFKRGWFKTFFASYSIAAFYGLTMFIVVTLLTAQSIVNAADFGPVINETAVIEALGLDPQTTIESPQ